MPLAAGTRLGPYEVTAAIGAGGMGEVYRARDTRLNRDVAIKVLPASFAADPDRRARFEREAQAIAALSHPNILAIFDTGLHGGELFVVMELLEGETLRDRLAVAGEATSRAAAQAARGGGAPREIEKEGGLPARKSIDIAVQIARGLAAAHEKGLVHRDLKPENVFLLRDGRVKILDFGLARQMPNATDATETVNALTDPGTVMGTVGYMAPEQVRGQVTDGRTDLFALGAVLHEMLSGRPAFRRDTAAETMTAILREDPPDLTTARPDLSPALERIVTHCLEKNPTERFQTARDVAFALEGLSGSAKVPSGQMASGSPGVADGSERRTRRGLPVLPAAVAGLVLIAGAFAAGRWSSASDREWPSEWIGEDLGGSAVAFAPRISPNGQDLAFLAMVNNTTQVAVMRPGSGGWQALTTDRTRGLASGLSWSQDGTKIFFERIFEQPRGVFSVPLPAGQESPILKDAGSPRELPGGDLLVMQINADRLPQIHRRKRGSQTLEPLDAILHSMWSMYRVFPDGREVVFFGRPTNAPADEGSHLYALDLTTGRPRRLAPSARFSFVGTPQPDFPLAVTQTSVVFDLPSGDLHRITAAPRDGSDRLETLFMTTAEPANIDVGPDGAVYLDQVQSRQGIGRLSVDGQTPAFDEVPNLVRQVLPLPDGRMLGEIQTSGVRRLVTVIPGGAPIPFAPAIDEETRGPLAFVGANRVALLVGAGGKRQVAIATIADGLLVDRLTDIRGDDVRQLAGSPDGRTLFYVSSGIVWSIPDKGGTPRQVRAGDGVAVDPSGRYLVIKLDERDGVRLVRVPIAGGTETEIAVRSDLRLTATTVLAPNAIARDGRIAVRVTSPGSWYWPSAIIDPRTGRIEPLEREWTADHDSPGWSDDKTIVTGVRTAQSRLWRFRPAPAGQ